MIHFILSFLSVLIATKLVGVYYAGLLALIIFTILLTIVNATIKPVINFFTWPINFLTLGLFHLMINVLFLILVSHFTPGFVFASFRQTVIFSIVLSIVEWIIFKFEF